jgi:Ni/Fe-hydrogenase 1 B-type cytochrome subunit
MAATPTTEPPRTSPEGMPPLMPGMQPELPDGYEHQDEPARTPLAQCERVPVYQWDLIVRTTHWFIAMSLIVLAATGFYIGRPFLESSGPAREQFLTGYIKVIHSYAAIVFSLSVLARVIWMFTGPRRSGWRQFIPVSKSRRRDLLGTLKFYLMLRAKPPPATGHNALAGLTYVAVFFLYGVSIFSGFALYSVNAHTSYMSMWQFLLPIFHGAQGARWIHHVTMWLLLGFVIHHLWSAILVARVERNGTVDGIFSGWKFVPPEHTEDDL